MMRACLVIAVLVTAFSPHCVMFIHGIEADNFRGWQRRISILSERAELRDRPGRFKFPDDIEYTLDIEGLGIKHFRAKRVKVVNINPEIWTIGKDSKLHFRRKARREVEYYTNANGSYICKPSFRNGQPHCDLMGIIHDNGQSCFIKGDKADCEKKIEGTTEYVEVPEEPVPTVPYSGNRTNRNHQRERRQIEEVDNGVRVIQIAFVLDAAFIARFSRFNPSDIEAAREDAEMYITMVANEMTYRYQTVKDLRITFRGGILDLAVNPSQILYPEDENSDWPFIQKDSTYLYDTTLSTFAAYVSGGGIGGVFNHAMFVSGLDLFSSGPGLLGRAYLSTVCATNSNQFLRVSINEDRSYSLVDTAAHELGHAKEYIKELKAFLQDPDPRHMYRCTQQMLVPYSSFLTHQCIITENRLSAQHDSNGNRCPGDGYVMAALAVRPGESIKDTIFTFSSCSGDYFARHLSRFPDCLSTKREENFRQNFCEGPRGLRETSFDYQCQNYFEFGPNYTECDGITAAPASNCYEAFTVSCYPGSGDSCFSLPYIADGSPCIGPDSGKDYYCYNGDCVEENEICSDTTEEPDTPPPPPCACDRFGNFLRRLCCRFNACC